MRAVDRRSLLLAGASAALATLIPRPAVAQGWELHLAKLTTAIKCQAALFGQDALQWAGQSQLAPPSAEVRTIVAGFANPAALFAAAPKLLTVPYMCTRADGTSIQAKRGSDGFVAGKGLRTVALCKFSERDVSPAQANAAMQQFVAYLATLGY